MPEDVLFESESPQSRAAIARYLREVADKLDAGEPITLSAGEQSVTLDPPQTPTFEVKAEREGPTDGPGEHSIEFEIEWDEQSASGATGELTIE
ncbi:MAG: amphi-Trp domain-containing protein [Haloquadratum sp.]